MGKKLNIKEIETLISKNPNTVMFDRCVKCDGVEEYMSMESVDEETFDVICDECNNLNLKS